MADRGSGRKGRRPSRKQARSGSKRLLLLGIGAALVLGSGALWVLGTDQAVGYSSIEDHIKYGSTGSERRIGIPAAVFRALPALCADHLPAAGGDRPSYARLGFIYETDRALPVGFSRRRYQGIDLVGLNCGACHVGQVQNAEDREPRVYVGMPANTADLGAFARFLFACATDERFTPDSVLAAIDAEKIEIGFFERLRLRYHDIYQARETLLTLRARLRFADDQPDLGPGRVDTANALKALFGMEMGDPYTRPVAPVDFAAVWLQDKKAAMNLYWDGSNDSMQERHLLGAVHTGAVGTADMASVQRIRNSLETEEPPTYPYAVNSTLVESGKRVYASLCADCHGRDGRNFPGTGSVGQITPLDEIGTDSGRVRAYGDVVAAKQRTLSPDGEVNLQRFKPTEGYANVPLDGLWLRAPYLHNGSVPSLRALLEPSRNRPQVFYRGDWMYDPESVGFVSNVPERDGKRFFAYYTGLPGNSNRGHEGSRFGTELSQADKDALIEFLKRF